jgi:hypothetical protein
MAWLSKIFSSVGVNLVSTVGKVMDELITSDEEIALTENQKLKIQKAYEVKIRELLVDLDKQQAQHEENLESELTTRLKLDMKNDSWLSKNIRPMALIFMTATVAVLAFFTVFDSKLADAQLNALKEWIPFFKILMVVIYGFYFGSRGLEKFQKIRATGNADVEKIKRSGSADQVPKG